MNILFFSSDLNTIDEWNKRDSTQTIVCHDLNNVTQALKNDPSSIIIADYDTKASDINNWISSNTLPKNLIVLERVPEIATGKMLIYQGIKAYGNSKMLKIHYKQMIKAVKNNTLWTYPELTAALAQKDKKEILHKDSVELIKNKLSKKETEVVYLILDGRTNSAIANEMKITTRTVKAHISSIFNKLHVNDRLSLVLLLK